MMTNDRIKNEALKRFPVLNVWEGGHNGYLIDVNEAKRNVFIQGAEYASNEQNAIDQINIQVQGVPFKERANLRDKIRILLTNALPLTYHLSAGGL